MSERLTVWSSRRPWLALACWAVALVAAIAVTAAFLGDALSGDEEVTSSTESRRADQLEAERFAAAGGPPDETEIVVVRAAESVDAPRVEQAVLDLAAQLRLAGADQ